jgi:hypothetical protein
MRKSLPLVLLLVALPLQAAAAQSSGRLYRDPARTFSIRLPSGWTAEREGEVVVISSSEHTAKLAILAGRSSQIADASDEVKYNSLPELGDAVFRGWLGALRDGASRVSAGEARRTKVKGLDAMRMNVKYYRGNSPREGYGLYVVGDDSIYFITLTGDSSGLEALEDVFSTLRFE